MLGYIRHDTDRPAANLGLGVGGAVEASTARSEERLDELDGVMGRLLRPRPWLASHILPLA